MKLLFLGESWMGSSARSLKESLGRVAVDNGDEIDELNEDLYKPNARARWLRAVNRILAPAYRRELADALIKKCTDTCPEVLLVYKGGSIDAALIRTVKAMGVFAVNVFPDYSPHAYGERLREAIGEYDLVISTKPFHPALWQRLYGYGNRCVFVPHGYDPKLHLVSTPASISGEYVDVIMAANWRAEYDTLLRDVARLLPDSSISVAIAGPGWAERRHQFPPHWTYPGAPHGRSYINFLRRGRIAIAPVNRNVVIDGRRQPGDEDSTRTYELAAANCFFIHRRTDFVKKIFDEDTEVPMFDSAEELVGLIRDYLPKEELRRSMAHAAHLRANPAYSLDERARDVVREIMLSSAM
jgi:hypothetical protein